MGCRLSSLGLTCRAENYANVSVKCGGDRCRNRECLLTRPLFPAAQQILNANCDVEYWTQPERISKEELFRRVKDKDGLVCLLTEKVNDELLRAAPKLRLRRMWRWGSTISMLPACTKRGVVATNTPGVLDETTADFAWTLMMAVARRIGEGEISWRDRGCGRAGIWISWWARMFGGRRWAWWDSGGLGERWRGGRWDFR